ncbi:uncharacterized protein LOC119720088 [Patiria miniata]|uniref:G-protein coupled receptors family 2 profile 2 domain-containing protein n=2 Tax=Patiria miniata TaxID=46514 RepID=A0A913Z495_PATMI|nr:uncharacterized protein LOC119720088 [Patiria miniata]
MVDYETYKNTTVPPYWTPPLIGACPSGYNGSTELREGCAGYSASFTINESWYKNPHCALCNGEDLTSLDYCYREYGIVAPASLEIILGRDSDAWFPSPSLEIHLGDSVRCLRKEYHLTIVPKPSQSSLAIDPKESLPMRAYEAASCLIRRMAWQSVPLTLPFISQLLAVDAEEFPTGDGTLLSTSLGNFSDTKALLHGLLTVEETSDESVQDTWVDQCNLEVVELAEVCTIANVTNVRTCHHQWFSTKDAEVVSNISISNVSVLYLGNGVIVEPYYLSHVHVYRNTDAGRFFNETEVRVCGRELEQLTCRFPPVNDTLVIVRDGTVYLSYAGREFLEGEFVSLPDGLILICSDVFKEDGPYINLSEPLTLVNFLGFVISMAALVATFATYLTFSELRNVPGAAIMSLCAALFVAQLLSVTALGSTLNSSVCVTIAVVLHYLWLSTFTWQTVLAWDLRKTFASNRPSLGASKMKRFFLYSVYGWGAPVLVVSVFFAFHLCGDCMGLGYRYGSDKACWIIGRFAVLLAFGVPMMSSVILNGVLFATTVWGVHKTLKAASMVHQDRSKSQRASTELVIYLKISCVMGFTWILGCLAQVTSYRPLWFLFAITNSAQGVIIFVVYACNARVRAMWRQRLRRTEAKKSDSAARTTKASTPVTKGHSGNKRGL